MKNEWNLSCIYTGLDDPRYEQDIAQLQKELQLAHKTAQNKSVTRENIENILAGQERCMLLIEKLFSFVSLSLSTEATNGALMAQQARLSRMMAEAEADSAAETKILGSVTNVDELAKESPLIAKYTFLIKEAQKKCKHLLSDGEEAIIAAMDQTGGGAWGDLQSYLTSTLKVPYDGKTVTLSEVRNLAYDPDASVRKAAYEAELAACEKIEDSVAFSLNNIKSQVTMLCRKKGYESPLAMTLEQSRMSRETLDAMFSAVKEYLPAFRKYLRKKGELLGHGNGLPFYDLFAPVGHYDRKFSLDQARDCLVETFNELTPEMGSMMQKAFDCEWIDFYPRSGKSGGAFCAGLSWLKQSRILTNYDGTFGAVDTLAHELGHAYHNLQIENEPPLNRDYPMPVAETASTFNEIHLGAKALADAKPEEKIALLDSDLREKTQCVVDIYSRYLFETKVFEECQSNFLMAKDLKELMLNCQKEAYGDGLDPDVLHPYMWLCKSHYYSSGFSFYNFPYAFGSLFAQGLYALYQEQGQAFIANYREMLRTTAVHTIEEDGAMLGIDLTKKDFWVQSLEAVAREIEIFCKL